MKKSLPTTLEKFRYDHPIYEKAPVGSIEGSFMIPYAGVPLHVISGCGEGWDHVSVSTHNRTPTWEEMAWIKLQFFKPDETVIQLHPPESKYINVAKNVLHLWRCWDQKIKLPPRHFLA